MRQWILILLTMSCVSAFAQKPIHIHNTPLDSVAASQLKDLLKKGGCHFSSKRDNSVQIIRVGLYNNEHKQYKPLLDSLQEDGYFIVGDGNKVVLYGKGAKGTLYAVYAFLEMIGYRLYTPDAMVIPDVSQLKLPKCHIVSNPAFEWREVSYYYPNHSKLYADWHHLHTQADRNDLFGMHVHTFAKLIPPSRYFDSHPEWFSLNSGHRSRDGQLCLSNPEVLEVLCQRLSDTMSAFPQKKIWSVSPNDNYNACQCHKCRHLDSLYGGQSGTLLWFVNQVARRFPEKTIATLAYQYTRKAPTTPIKPDSNVLIMICPIESGRQAPITETDPAFKKDMDDWSSLTSNIYLWDYVVQFRNFWDPFPNLHVLQPNLRYFRDNGVSMMFEQASGANNITSWMDIRCYMIAKLMWDPYANMDSIMTDFYNGYYGNAGKYVKEIIDTMTTSLIESGQTLNIYGYPIDAADGYLSPARIDHYYKEMQQAYTLANSMVSERLRFFEMALDFASIELKANDMYGDFEADDMTAIVDSFTASLKHYGVGTLMEMGISPDAYGAMMRNWSKKTFGRALAWERPVSLRKAATAPYDIADLTDGQAGIMDYRHNWLGFWGDTLDAVIDLGEPAMIHEVSLDFYFFPLSWIFLPQSIALYVSDDGGTWRQIYEANPRNPEILATPDIQTFTFESSTPLNARYLRVIAEPLPEIPAWHRASGLKPWIFTDEITVK